MSQEEESFGHYLIHSPFLYIIIGIVCLMIGLHFLYFAPTIDRLNEEMKDKTNAEHNKIVSMNCKQLGNWLLQDDVYAHENLILAQNTYLVNCK